MPYQVDVSKPVQKYLEKLPVNIYLGLKKAILSLKDNPRPPGAIKMTGQEAYRI